MNLNEASELAHKLLAEHDLHDWTFAWDNAKRRFGQCNHHNKTITLSRYLVGMNNEAQVKDTILHEIAHALCGPRVGHGIEWQRMCLRVGAIPERTYNDLEVELPQPRYIGQCPNGHRYHRHRMTKSTRAGTSCSRCANRFDPRYMISWYDTMMEQWIVRFT